jgi:hypothetical protein
MCFSLIFNLGGRGADYTVLYSLQIVKPSGIWPWNSRAEYYLILRINEPKDRPYGIGIYFPFKTGNGTVTVETAVSKTYFEEDMTRENYLGQLYQAGFACIRTIPWILNFDEEGALKFKKKLHTIYNSDDDGVNMKLYMEDVQKRLSGEENAAWHDSLDCKPRYEKYGTLLRLHFVRSNLLKPGTILILKIVFPNAQAEHTRTRFWAASALILKYPYGHLEHNLCPPQNIVDVLYYRFKFLHPAHVEFNDGDKMEIRPPFVGWGPPASAEGQQFARERNTIFFNLGIDSDHGIHETHEIQISWQSRLLQISVPILTFVIGLVLGISKILPFLK